DADALKPFERFMDGLVIGRGPADLRVVDGNGREIDPAAVQIKIFAVDPEFAKAELCWPTDVENTRVCIGQRNLRRVLILRRINIPKLIRLPSGSKPEMTVGDICRREGAARKLGNLLPLADHSFENIGVPI